VLPTLISARLRGLVILLAALLLAGGFIGLSPRPAAAAGGACGNWFDNPGTVYQDSYTTAAGWQFWDNWQHKYTHMDAEFYVWRYTTTGSDGYPAGHCLSQAFAGGWVDDGSYGSDQLSYLFTNSCHPNFNYGGTGYNWEGSNGVYAAWFDVSGCGLLKGYAIYAGKNPDWTGYWPSDVPSAVVDIR
jgi:hypothetical protein